MENREVVSKDRLIACQYCGKIQQAPPRSSLRAGWEIVCSQCETPFRTRGPRGSGEWSGALALAALIILPFALTLPVVRVEHFGHAQDVGIWSGCRRLLEHGDYAVGLIVLVCSVVLPTLKLLVLLYLSLAGRRASPARRASLHGAIEMTGRWGMLDVFAVAALVAAVKMEDIITMHSGPGIIAFSVCVGLSMLACALLNPQSFKEEI